MKASYVSTEQVVPDQHGAPGPSQNGAGLQQVICRLTRIEAMVTTLVEQRQIQDWYGTAAAAKILSKSAYSVREWCRLGRVHAEKRSSGRGRSKEWMISHEELMRIKSEGLLPQRPPQGRPSSRTETSACTFAASPP